ncbi:UNVERIFIED_CONTAM: hypothetical protein K2H54_067469 [Gekko kuhli]
MHSFGEQGKALPFLRLCADSMDVRSPGSPPERQLIPLGYISVEPLSSEAAVTLVPEDGCPSAVPPASKMTLPVYSKKYETKESLSHKKENRSVTIKGSQGTLSTGVPRSINLCQDQ